MSDHAEKQVHRMEKRRKLAAEGHFLAGDAMYDKHGNTLPTGTVPAESPRMQPERGALTAHPDEQHPPVPRAPVTPDPYGGTVSESHANPPESIRRDVETASQEKDKSPNKARVEKKEAGHAGPE